MLKKKDLEKQKTFIFDKDKNAWFSDYFKYKIKFENKGACFYICSEISDNDDIFLKTLDNYQDLIDSYYMISGCDIIEK